MSERCFAYAIVPVPAAPLPPEVTGLRGATVGFAPSDGVGAWASCLAPFEATREDLLAHHRVVEAVCDLGPALPVRFGTSFPDEAALARALAPKADALRAALDAVGRKREFAITLAWREPPEGEAERPAAPPAAGPGRRYLVARAAHWAARESRRARATELERELSEVLGAAGVEPAAVKSRIVPAPRVALSCAVLIEPARSADAMRRVREGAAGWADVAVHLAGPWPAYSFTDLAHGE